MKSLSIVIPVYNGEKFIENCIKSIANQDNGKIEVIMVNDGSKDNSVEICLKMAKEYPFIKYFEKENGGVSSARNFALDKINGEYVWFVDVDDNISTGVIQKKFEIESDLAVFNYVRVTDNEEKVINVTESDYTYNLLSFDEFFNSYVFNYKLNNALWNKVFKVSIIKENGLTFDETVKIGEDFMFGLSYYKFTRDIYFSTLPIYRYYINQSGAMKSKNKDVFYYQTSVAETVANGYSDLISSAVKDRFLLMQLICAIGQSKANGISKEEIINNVKLYKEKFNVTFSKKVVKAFLQSENAGLLGKLRVKLIANAFNKGRYSLLKKII